MKRILVFFLAGIVTASGWAGSYSPELVKKAEAGDSQSQCALGHYYFHGDGVPRDLKESFKWYKKSAEQGNALAQYRLGNLYFGETL